MLKSNSKKISKKNEITAKKISSKKKDMVKKNTAGKIENISVKKQYVRRRSEIYGIIVIMFAILFILSFFNFGGSGILTRYFNDFFSFIFGITKYLVAFLLLLWGISFFIRRVRYLPSVFALGFIMLFISVSGLMNVNIDIADIFDPLVMKIKGGVAGAGIYYGLFKLVGKAGAVTILAVLAVIGIIIVFRISIIDMIRKIDKRQKLKRQRQESGIRVYNDSMGSKISYNQDGTFNRGIQTKQTMSEKSWKEAPENDVFLKKGVFIDNSSKQKVFDAEKVMDDSRTGRLVDKDMIMGKKISGDEDITDRQKFSVDISTDTLKKSGTGQLKIPIYEDNADFDLNYKLPPISILKRSDSLSPKLYKKNVSENVNTLNQLFYYFNLPAKIASVTRGPSITLYEVTLSQGVKVSKLLSLEDDFCVALGSPDIRFLTPIPGKSAIGIEVPNKVRSLVTLGDIFLPSDEVLMNDLLTVPLGKDFSGDIVHMTINNMPHILIAGATNSGKSVCLNALIISLLMKVKPSQVKMIMVDPKMVELSMYNGIPHLLAPVIVDPRKAASVLSWVLEEMKNRFQLLLDFNCKTLEEYNFMVKKDSNKDPELKPIPYILVIIDELADLMMVAASEVEDSICRLAQMARAVGIHLIISTQKPVVKILTGLIKTNIPARIAFKVTDFTDSRVILEHGGAEKLIGKGDMLYLSPQHNRPERLQGAFITTKEIGLITNYIKNQMKAEYNSEITDRFAKKEERIIENDDLLYDALKVVVEMGHASASLLQRKLRLGYSRAARIIDQLEEKGFIGSYDGSKPREVLVSKEELREMFERGKQD